MTGKDHKKPITKTKISVTLTPDILACIDARGDNRSAVLNRDSTRYYRFLADTCAALSTQFSSAELSLIVDACNNGNCWETLDRTVKTETRRRKLDKKWKVPEPLDLIERLCNLTWLEKAALCDAVERFWHAAGDDETVYNPAQALD